MPLPLFKDSDDAFQLLQTKWKSIIDPLLAKPEAKSIILTGVSLNSGINVIPHLLGRKLVGWKPVRLRAQAVLSDQQDSNQMPDKTLVIFSSAAVVADLEVF